VKLCYKLVVCLERTENVILSNNFSSPTTAPMKLHISGCFPWLLVAWRKMTFIPSQASLASTVHDTVAGQSSASPTSCSLRPFKATTSSASSSSYSIGASVHISSGWCTKVSMSNPSLTEASYSASFFHTGSSDPLQTGTCNWIGHVSNLFHQVVIISGLTSFHAVFGHCNQLLDAYLVWRKASSESLEWSDFNMKIIHRTKILRNFASKSTMISATRG
jgi:hypothetical protein